MYWWLRHNYHENTEDLIGISIVKKGTIARMAGWKLCRSSVSRLGQIGDEIVGGSESRYLIAAWWSGFFGAGT